MGADTVGDGAWSSLFDGLKLTSVGELTLLTEGELVLDSAPEAAIALVDTDGITDDDARALSETLGFKSEIGIEADSWTGGSGDFTSELLEGILVITESTEGVAEMPTWLGLASTLIDSEASIEGTGTIVILGGRDEMSALPIAPGVGVSLKFLPADAVGD